MRFRLNSVNPIYYVFFSSATILASMIFFQGLNTSSGVNTTSLVCGFLTTFLGVYLLNLSRTIPSSSSVGESNERNGHRRRVSHSFLETGMLNPRISISSDRHRDSFDSLRGEDTDEEAYPLRNNKDSSQLRGARQEPRKSGSSGASYNHHAQGLNGHNGYATVTDTDGVHSPTSMHLGGQGRSPTNVVFDIGNDDDDMPRSR